MSEANKSSHDAHWNSAKATEMPVPSNREERNHVFVNGGALSGVHYLCLKMPHFIPYVTCMLTIVFDDKGPSTKDTAHLQPSSGVAGVEVKFEGNMPLKLKKKKKKTLFLANCRNKQTFMLMLHAKFQHCGFQTIIMQKVMPTYSFAKL